MIGLGLGLYFKRRKNNESIQAVEHVDVVNSNDEDNHSEAPPSPSSGSQIYLGPGTAFDLDIRKDQSSSALNLEEQDV